MVALNRKFTARPADLPSLEGDNQIKVEIRPDLRLVPYAPIQKRAQHYQPVNRRRRRAVCQRIEIEPSPASAHEDTYPWGHDV